MSQMNKKRIFRCFVFLCLCGMVTTQMWGLKVEAEEAQTAVGVQLTKALTPGEGPNKPTPQPSVPGGSADTPQPSVPSGDTDNQQTSGVGATQGTKKPVKVVLTTSSFLPHTGEKRNSWFIGFGCLFIGMGVVFLRQRKEGNKNESL